MVWKNLTSEDVGAHLREAGADVDAWLSFAIENDYELRSKHHEQYYSSLNRALETEPFISNVDMWYHLCHWSRAAPEDPVRHLFARRRILELAPDTLFSYLHLADLLSTLGTGEAIEVRTLYETAVRKWPATPVGWQRLLNLEWERFGDVPAVLQTLQRGAAELGYSRPLWAALANQLAYAKAGPAVVKQFYDYFLKQPLRPARVLRSFGAALLPHDRDLALAAFRSAVETEPRNHRCWIDLARALRVQGKPAEGIEVLDQALPQVSSKVPVWNALLRHHEKAGSPVATFSELAQRLRGMPFGDDHPHQRAKTWDAMAKQLVRLENYPEAEAACRNALGESPGYRRAAELLVWLLTYRLGRHEEAIEVADAYFVIDDYYRAVPRYKAHAFGEGLKRWDEAITILRAALSEDDHQPETWAMLAVYLSWQTGHPPDRQAVIDEEAAAAFNRMRDAKSPWAWRHYGNFLRDKRHDVAAATKAFQRADQLARV
jgi:tetratricopeptide (TPR) repeat protein